MNISILVLKTKTQYTYIMYSSRGAQSYLPVFIQLMMYGAPEALPLLDVRLLIFAIYTRKMRISRSSSTSGSLHIVTWTNQTWIIQQFMYQYYEILFRTSSFASCPCPAGSLPNGKPALLPPHSAGGQPDLRSPLSASISAPSAASFLCERSTQEKAEQREVAMLMYISVIVSAVTSFFSLLVGLVMGLYKRSGKDVPRPSSSPMTTDSVLAEVIEFANYTPPTANENLFCPSPSSIENQNYTPPSAIENLHSPLSPSRPLNPFIV